MGYCIAVTSQESLSNVKDGHALAAAIVDTVRESLVVLDRQLRVITASRSFYAVSLGLIVTELVINALKHAFHDRDEGEIIVTYGVNGADWQLSVADNGVGRSDDGSGGPDWEPASLNPSPSSSIAGSGFERAAGHSRVDHSCRMRRSEQPPAGTRSHSRKMPPGT